MNVNRLASRGAAASLLFFAAIFSLSFSSSLLAAEGVTLLGLVPHDGIVKGPVGTILNGNFSGPMLDGQNSVEAKFHYELDSAPTGQVYVGVWDPQSLLPRRLLGAEHQQELGNVSFGSRSRNARAPASASHDRVRHQPLQPPPTTRRSRRSTTGSPSAEFTCPAVKVTPKQMQPRDRARDSGR